MRTMLASALAVAAVIGVAPERAEACSPIWNDPYATDARHGTDALPPGPVTAGITFRAWHEAPDCPPARGYLTVTAHATDDLSGADVGFELHDVDGVMAFGMEGPSVPGFASDPGELVYYTDTAQVPFDLEIEAVDRFGNHGPATRFTVSEVHWLDDDDAGSGGCAASRGTSVGGVPLVLALLALAGLRRRR